MATLRCRVSQRRLPSWTMALSWLARSVRFSRARRRYWLLTISSCVSRSWTCLWKPWATTRIHYRSVLAVLSFHLFRNVSVESHMRKWIKWCKLWSESIMAFSPPHIIFNQPQTSWAPPWPQCTRCLQCLGWQQFAQPSSASLQNVNSPQGTCTRVSMSPQSWKHTSSAVSGCILSQLAVVLEELWKGKTI